jgi:pyruvate formate lyase activating enzyme
LAITGLIFAIERFAVHDGPGIRTAVFLKGCPLRCWWCHSPESQSPQPEALDRPQRCIRCRRCLEACPNDAIAEDDTGFSTRRGVCTACGACAAVCPSGAREIAGRTVTVDDLLGEIEKDRIFFDRSGGGVTFTGGEPLMQPAFLGELIAASRACGIRTAVETCGLGSWSAMAALLGADLVLYDLKLQDDTRHRWYTGVSNRPILRNLVRLAGCHPAVRVRVPLVPGINDDSENLTALAQFVAAIGLADVDVLPYHTTGVDKYRRLGRTFSLSGLEPPTGDALVHARMHIEQFGLTVHLGGRP